MLLAVGLVSVMLIRVGGCLGLDCELLVLVWVAAREIGGTVVMLLELVLEELGA